MTTQIPKAWDSHGTLIQLVGMLATSNLLHPAGDIIDAGCNNGHDAKLYAELFWRRTVWCVDPVHANVRTAEQSLRGIPNIRVLHGALSDKAGEGTYSAYLETRSAERKQKRQIGKIAFWDRYSHGDKRGSVRYPIYTTDRLFENRTLAFAQFDMEGDEPNALAGALQTIARDKPLLVVETLPKSEERIHAKLLLVLQNLGYASVELPDRCGALEDCRNLFCFHKSKTDLVRQQLSAFVPIATALPRRNQFQHTTSSSLIQNGTRLSFADELERDFLSLLGSETGVPVDPQGLRIFLGILSSPSQANSRRVHRQTWMLSPHVCERGFTTHCAFRVSFVLHLPELPSESEQQAMAAAEGRDDLMFLQASSVVKKKYAFLKAVLERCPDATHLAKVDLDTFINADALLRELLPAHGHEVFYGKFVSGRVFSTIANSTIETKRYALCHEEEDANLGRCCRPSPSCSVKDGFDRKCWMGAQGALWLMSRQLAEYSGLCLARIGKETECVHEDIDVGRCVGLALRASAPMNRSTTAMVNSQGLVFCRPHRQDGMSAGLQCHTDANGDWSRPWYHMYYSASQMSRMLRLVQRESTSSALVKQGGR